MCANIWAPKTIKLIDNFDNNAKVKRKLTKRSSIHFLIVLNEKNMSSFQALLLHEEVAILLTYNTHPSNPS